MSKGSLENEDLLAHPKSIEIEAYLGCKLTDKRYLHVLSVREMAINLAKQYDADIHKTNLAALLHDCAKWMSASELYEAAENGGIQLDEVQRRNPSLLHAIVGAQLAVSRFEVVDPDILSAIRTHTTGSGSMTRLDKILYVADFAEPKRPYKEAAPVRSLACQDLNRAVLAVSRYKIEHLLAKGAAIHPHAIDAYNSALREMSEAGVEKNQTPMIDA